jgi:hypothetical protein
MVLLYFHIYKCYEWATFLVSTVYTALLQESTVQSDVNWNNKYVVRHPCTDSSLNPEAKRIRVLSAEGH